jgi:CubicO group peptidase (beta-lactamase class C family)
MPHRLTRRPRKGSHVVTPAAVGRTRRRIFAAVTVLALCAAGGPQRGLAQSPPPPVDFGFLRSPDLRWQDLAPAATARPIVEDLQSPERAALRAQAQAALERPGTLALALIERGVLVYEGHAGGWSASDRYFSFSVAKSLTALAVGEALCAGRIRSLDDTALAYAPQLSGTAYGEASVRHLLMMASGAQSGGPDLSGQPHPGAFGAEMMGRKTVSQQWRDHGRRARGLFSEVRAGERFDYNNLDTAALGAVVAGATGEPFHAWFGRTVVEKAGLSETSRWNLDRDGRELNYAAYSATLRDWVRLALRFRAVLRGEVDEPCLRAFLEEGTRTRIATHARSGFMGYGYQIWTDYAHGARGAFWMLGYGGQRVAVDLGSDRIMVTFATSPQEATMRLYTGWVRSQ